MKLTDVLPVDKLIGLEKDIAAWSGLDSNVFDTDGFRVTDFKKWVNRLCPVIKADDRGQSFICATAHMNISGMAKKRKDIVIEECDAGLMKLIVPIIINEEFLGVVGGCGVLLDDGNVDSFMINRTIGMDEEKITSLSNDIRRITRGNAEAIGRYVKERLENIISDLGTL